MSVSIDWDHASADIRALWSVDEDARAAALEREPGLRNALLFDRALRSDPDTYNFLLIDSPYYWVKLVSTEIYRRILAPELNNAGGLAIDVGCGIGRSTTLLADHFDHVIGFDATPSALALCETNLSRIGIKHHELHWDGPGFLARIPSDRANLVLALEFVCYHSDPVAVLTAMSRAARPGGVLAASVEGWPGALTLWSSANPGTVMEAGRGNMITGDERSVRFETAESLRALCAAAGWEDVRVIGSHYLVEGPFWQCVDDARLFEAEYRETVIAADEACRLDPGLAPLARVWTAVGRKGGQNPEKV